MIVEILDSNFQFVDYLYEFESFIWTDRYNKPGDFEIFAPAKSKNLNLFKRNRYVKIDSSEHMMIIEDVVWQSSAESGDHVKVTGRSLESLLDRRIVWGEYTMPATEAKDVQSEVFALIENEIINGRDIAERKIPNFVCKVNSDIPGMSESLAGGDFKGDSLLTIVEDLTDEYDFGWKIIYDEDTEKLVFSFFAGVDRTEGYDLGERGFVEFSPEYENVIESTYSEISSDTKTAMLVGGTWTEEQEEPVSPSDENEEPETPSEEPIYEAIGGGSGILRREIFYESNVDKDEEMTKSEYCDAIRLDGGKELLKYRLVSTFDGKYETNIQFKYGKNFFIGDIVTVKDVFGHTASARVTEFIRSINISNGEEAYPTFEMVIPDEDSQ